MKEGTVSTPADCQTGVVRAVIVIPCFNEEHRLDVASFRTLAREQALVFVDDGSTDGTRGVLRTIDGAEVLALDPNRGKGEAVRQGLLHAIAGGADVVGYLDADLSTPAAEMAFLLDKLGASSYEAVIAARVALAGWDVHRRLVRHYPGRIYATLASSLLARRVYDTQTGAKVFRVGPCLQRALAEPFVSRWSFDVELIGRLDREWARAGIDPVRALYEHPIHTWHDVPGSKLHPAAMFGATADLAKVWAALRRY